MKTSKVIFSLLLVLCLIAFLDQEVFSQCSMCKKSAADGGKAGGINLAIVYLGTIPYMIFSVIAFLWYKNIRKKDDPANLFGFIKKKLAE
jgi:hypothetical protein